MKKYKKVIVLGAGFSKALCNSMPIIDNLLDDIDKNSLLADFVERTKKELNEYFDVENCISYILSREIFFNYKEDIEFYTLRKELLKHIYEKMKDSQPDMDKMELMEKFLYYCIEEEAVLITFNYDLFIEKICEYLNKQSKIKGHMHNLVIDYALGINESLYKDKGACCKYYDYKEIELLKLHGSFNWFNINKYEDANTDDIKVLNECDINDLFYEDIPFFVPMSNTKHKYFAGNFYRILWKKMKYYIDNAKELNFIGYGFPRTDFDNLMLFNSHRDKIKNIVLFNSEKDMEKKKKLEKIFTNASICTKGAINYISELVKDISLNKIDMKI